MPFLHRQNGGGDAATPLFLMLLCIGVAPCGRQQRADRVVRPYARKKIGERAVREAGPYGCGALFGRLIAAPTGADHGRTESVAVPEICAPH